MAKNEERNGQREYGIVHLVEEEMRENRAGVFAAKNAGRAPANKAVEAAPENKAAEPASATMSMTKAELLKVAKAEGVTVTDDNNKEEIIAKIEAARKG